MAFKSLNYDVLKVKPISPNHRIEDLGIPEDKQASKNIRTSTFPSSSLKEFSIGVCTFSLVTFLRVKAYLNFGVENHCYVRFPSVHHL